MKQVIVKRADGTFEFRNEEGLQLADGETLVARGSADETKFLRSEIERLDAEEEAAQARADYEARLAARVTPAVRKQAQANGDQRGNVAVLDPPDDQQHRDTAADFKNRKGKEVEARRGMGLEVYNKMTNEEARGSTEHFAEFMWRLKFDPVYTKRRVEMARRADRDLHDSQVDMVNGGELGTGADFATRALAEGSIGAGGALVPPQYIQEVLDIARSEAVAFQAGVQMRQTNSNLIYLPTLATAATASWISENGAITPTDQTFGQQSASVSKIGAGGKLSNEVIHDADPSILEIVQQDLARVIALCLDIGILEGSGSTPVIRGIANTSGITAGGSLGVNGGTPTIDALYDTFYALNAANIYDEDQWAVVFHPRALNSLRKIKDTTGNYILSSAAGVNAPIPRPRGLLGLPYYMSTQLSIARTVGTSSDCTNIYLGRFREMMAFMSGGFTIDLSTDAADATNSAFWSDQTWIRAKQRVGFLVRRPAGIAVITGVRP